MEFLHFQDTTLLVPIRQDTVVISDTIPATVTRVSLADLDSVMQRMEKREETIRIQQAKPLEKPAPPVQKIFYYSHLLFQEDMELTFRQSLFPELKKEKQFTEIVPVPVLGQDDLIKSRTSGNEYLIYFSKKAEPEYLQAESTGFPSWVFYMVIFSFVTLALLRRTYVRFLQPVLTAVLSHKETVNLYANRNSITQNTFLVLHFLFAVNTGLFFYLTGNYFDILADSSSFYTFLILAGGVFLLYQLKFLILYILGFFFDQTRAFNEYIHTIALFNKFLGILLLPLSAGMILTNEQFSHYFIYAGAGLIVLCYLARVIRGAIIILEKGFSVFYMFLYLCALEILPLLIVYKLFQLQIN